VSENTDRAGHRGYSFSQHRAQTTGAANRQGGSIVAQDFKQGDRVKWNTPQGQTYGKVKKKLTSSTEVGGQKVNASEDDPRYLIESEKSGKEAAHKPDSLSKA